MKPIDEDFNDYLKLNKKSYKEECEDYWKSLSYEDQLKAFYSVVKRIHKGEIEDRGTYRWVLYDVFHFGPDAYALAMECGYMDLHNRIMNEQEYKDRINKLRSSDGGILY